MDVFLWPKIEYQFHQFFNFSKDKVSDVENQISHLYTGVYPVLVSSGRSGLVLALEYLKLNRNDMVGIAPYSSACIYQLVGKITNPVPNNLENKLSSILLYHQWGFKHKISFEGPIIEDSVDSMILSSKALFPNNGLFEIVSLSKLFGLPYGGILFCKREEDAIKIKKLRESELTLFWAQHIMRFLSKYGKWADIYWNNAEIANGSLPDFVSKSILNALDKFDGLIEDRKEKIKRVIDILPPWLKLSNDRLPCVIPIKCSQSLFKRFELMGYISGIRHFNSTLDQANWNLKKVFPIPIHQDVSMRTFEKSIFEIEKEIG